MTPKYDPNTKTRLESTTGQSFLTHSKDPTGLTISKIIHSPSNSNLFETFNGYKTNC